MSEGLVVESVGRNWRIDSMSPVSATTVVIARSWSSLLGIKASRAGVGVKECRAAADRFQAAPSASRTRVSSAQRARPAPFLFSDKAILFVTVCKLDYSNKRLCAALRKVPYMGDPPIDVDLSQKRTRRGSPGCRVQACVVDMFKLQPPEYSRQKKNETPGRRCEGASRERRICP